MHYTGTNSAHFNGFKTISGTIMHQIRVNALERKIHFDISAEYLHNLFEKQEGKCALSGMSIQLYTTRKDKKNATASLDRINSSIGYIEGNVQWVHKHMNFMKLDFTQEQFINYCRLVVKHFS